jgi:hypothetical protein
VRKKVVSQQHRLGVLEVGVPGQVGIARFPRTLEQDFLKRYDAPANLGQRTLGEQPHVGGHLVVAAPPRVEPATNLASDLGDTPFDGSVDIFVAGFEDEDPVSELLAGGGEGCQQGGGLLSRKQTAALEAEHVSPAASYVVTSEATVKREALGKGEELRRLLVPAEAALPERHRRSHYLLSERESQSSSVPKQLCRGLDGPPN